jgi:hypothetical protein
MTADGLTRVQTNVSFPVPAATTYLEFLQIKKVQLPSFAVTIPTFITLNKGAAQKNNPYKTFFKPATSAPMTSMKGATVVTRPSNVNSRTFQPQQNTHLPHVENVSLDRADNFHNDLILIQHLNKADVEVANTCNNSNHRQTCKISLARGSQPGRRVPLGGLRRLSRGMPGFKKMERNCNICHKNGNFECFFAKIRNMCSELHLLMIS